VERWEEIKAQEKAAKAPQVGGLLESVPRNQRRYWKPSGEQEGGKTGFGGSASKT
jgi:hypothetical protein